MSNRDFGFIAIGRFLAVERYRETCLLSSTQQLRAPGPDRTGARPTSWTRGAAPGHRLGCSTGRRLVPLPTTHRDMISR